MNTFALINSQTNVVDNLIVLSDSSWHPPVGYFIVMPDDGEECLIGQTYNARMTPRFSGSVPVEPKVYTAYQFLLRFTADERASFRAASITDPVVADIQQLCGAAQEVWTNDPLTVQGLSYLVSIGLLTQQRYNEILG